jgi:glycosyltransferase involved in cell wall biosynthesis
MATRNGATTLPKVLAGYAAQTLPQDQWTLIVIDNGSTDDTAAVIQTYRDRLPLRYLHVPEPGKNVALNHGLALALQQNGNLLVFTDDDATPVPGWLQALAEAAQAHPEATLFGGSIVADWGAPPADWVLRLVPLGLTFGITDPALADGPIFPGLIWGANMAVRRAVFDQGYRFDETIGPNGGAYAMGSETQLTRMLGDAGHQSHFCKAAEVGHYIRPQQLSEESILQRAWRFGRGKFRQDGRLPVPYLFGVPRWMLARYLVELVGLGKARLRGDSDGRFRHRWELHYLRGYFHEAWRAPRAKRRVLITGFNGALGGMELRMAQEARFLNGLGWHSTLGVRPFPGSAAWLSGLHAERLDASHFAPPPFLEEWRWRRLRLGAALLTALPRLRRMQLQLVHVAFCWTYYGASALWLAARAGVPAVISVHNAFPRASFSGWQDRRMREAFATVRGVYAVSQSALEHFLETYRPYLPPAARLTVIPNCVDTRRFQPSAARRQAARAAWGIADDAPVLGSVGRLADQKRPLALLELLAALRPQFPHIRLVLIGTGPLEQAVRQRSQALGLEQAVVFAGFVPRVDEVLPGLDLHVLLSRNEGFGIATAEAMACGVPAVGTDVPGTADVLRGSEAGMLVPLDDADQAAKLVADLLRDPARRARMAAAGPAEATARFGEEHVRDMVRAFYEEL